MYNILIIEDEAKIARFVTLELEHEGYRAKSCFDGAEGLSAALKNDYDLIILDIMLPSMNGLDILKALRAEKDTPVILLSARDQVMDKVGGLESGADDYISKPFAIEELLARIRVILKRRYENNGMAVNIGGLTIGTDEHSVKYDGEQIALTKKEYDLLLFLARHKGTAVTREKILQTVWGYDFFGDTNVVDVYIRYLRGKIDDKYGVKLIETIRGTGYIIKGSGQYSAD